MLDHLEDLQTAAPETLTDAELAHLIEEETNQ